MQLRSDIFLAFRTEQKLFLFFFFHNCALAPSQNACQDFIPGNPTRLPALLVAGQTEDQKKNVLKGTGILFLRFACLLKLGKLKTQLKANLPVFNSVNGIFQALSLIHLYCHSHSDSQTPPPKYFTQKARNQRDYR